MWAVAEFRNLSGARVMMKCQDCGGQVLQLGSVKFRPQEHGAMPATYPKASMLLIDAYAFILKLAAHFTVDIDLVRTWATQAKHALQEVVE